MKTTGNIFAAQYPGDSDDASLVRRAQNGEKSALEALIKKHQGWIYNIALRMVGSPDDAQDITQEILIKVLTKISSFGQRSSFRTWLYRIVSNHVIDMKKRRWERVFYSLDRHTRFKEKLENIEREEHSQAPPDETVLVEETKMVCMTGMLLCLDRTQRLVFILGAILGIGSELGGEVLEISPANFRQILSRTRKQLGAYMNEQCGLINEKHTCRCAHKTRACIDIGLVDPKNLTFQKEYVARVKDFVSQKQNMADNVLDSRVQNLFRDHPLLRPPDFTRWLNSLLKQKDINQFINFS
jgi:RNA polymerase sigma factor (sigma-70 family)